MTFDIETPIYVGDDLSHKKAVNGTLFLFDTKLEFLYNARYLFVKMMLTHVLLQKNVHEKVPHLTLLFFIIDVEKEACCSLLYRYPQ